MKRIILFSMLTTLFFISCQKNNTPNEEKPVPPTEYFKKKTSDLTDENILGKVKSMTRIIDNDTKEVTSFNSNGDKTEVVLYLKKSNEINKKTTFKHIVSQRTIEKETIDLPNGEQTQPPVKEIYMYDVEGELIEYARYENNILSYKNIHNYKQGKNIEIVKKGRNNETLSIDSLFYGDNGKMSSKKIILNDIVEHYVYEYNSQGLLAKEEKLNPLNTSFPLFHRIVYEYDNYKNITDVKFYLRGEHLDSHKRNVYKKYDSQNNWTEADFLTNNVLQSNIKRTFEYY